MVTHKNRGKRLDLDSMPSGNPYASIPMDDDDTQRQKITDKQKHAYIKDLQDPYAHIEIFGDFDAVGNVITLEGSDKFSEKWMLAKLASYLPKAPTARDRKVIKSMASEFTVRVNSLTPEQRMRIKGKLSSMVPEGGMSLEAARTTPSTIKDALWKLLSEVTK